VIGIKREVPEKFVFVPSAEFVIKATDTLLVVGSQEDISKLKEIDKT
jgi:trk system potassium uptake protein TrkA